ncbi:hypothetical protein GCM10011414_29220 [Croceivirga lutea]|uniref:TetR family transcriptional regulator C-terminal domain-containing protein n=1 Tax=Croceivirga lutea TaxID=1775167 RepID=UPI001639FFF8|nr:TetR family transcriptional regulator C-terminal domain-containing protein [Croceivirga lutea]GGG57558.1 hypothetical protein GCM10011414_29220 [Croceivirga lutea]
MATKAATKKIDSNKLIALYMDYVLENDAEPKSVYKFCKDVKIDESDFYNYYGSIESIRKGIWVKFYDNTFELLDKNKEYLSFTNRDKMLTFFFTFFELLTQNRSYVLFTLQNQKNKLESLEQLKGLRKKVKEFSGDLIEQANEEKTLNITKQNKSLFSEGAWLQLLFLLRFWLNDSSAGFEDTDVAIEKSVRTIFDVFDNSVLESIIDFGKFLYQSSKA